METMTFLKRDILEMYNGWHDKPILEYVTTAAVDEMTNYESPEKLYQYKVVFKFRDELWCVRFAKSLDREVLIDSIFFVNNTDEVDPKCKETVSCFKVNKVTLVKVSYEAV